MLNIQLHIRELIASGWGITYLILVPLLLSWIFTPVSIYFANKWGVVDQPSARKVHQNAIPRMGGTALFSAVFITLLLIVYLIPTSDLPPQFWPIFAGGILIFALGLLDDFSELSPKIKFAWQFLVAIGLVSTGLIFDTVTNPFGDTPFQLGWIAYPLTVFWIVGIINAINLSDGLDGLAAGMSVIVLFTMSGIAWRGHNYALLLITLPLIGSTLGFLRYNFSPAKTFMGDSGSLFLGYMLAVLSIHGSTAAATTITILIPLVALGLPIFDTLFAIFRRIALQKGPFHADKEHVHHKLLSMGFDHKQTVLILYLISLTFCALAFLMTVSQNEDLAGFFLLYLAGVYLLVRRLGYLNHIFHFRNEFRKRLNRALYKQNYREINLASRFFKRLINNFASLFLLDILNITLAYLLSMYMLNQPFDLLFETPRIFHYLFVIAMVSISFFIGHCYNDVWRYIEFNGFGRYFKSLTFASLIIFFFAPHVFPSLILSHQFYLSFWVFLLTGTLFLRLILNFYYNLVKRMVSQTKKGERVLIYGAGDTGEILLHLLTKHDDLNYQVIGFVDDNPSKLHKKIYRYPILGQTHNIPELCKQYKIDRIILSTTQHSQQKERSILALTCPNGVKVGTMSFSIDDHCPQKEYPVNL